MVEILGIPSRECPLDDCPQYNCYQECEHRNKVLDSLQAKPLRKQGFLYDLIQSILAVQEEVLEWMCREPDIVELGTSLGFPPLQCGLLEYCPGQRIACPVSTCYGCEEEIKTSCDAFELSGCEPCYYRELVPHMTSCCGLTSCDERDTCPKPTWVDLSEPDYLPIYTEIVNFLACKNELPAGGALMTELLDLLGGKLLGLRDGIYNIELPGDQITRSIVTVINAILPLPVGAEAKFFIEVCD